MSVCAVRHPIRGDLIDPSTRLVRFEDPAHAHRIGVRRDPSPANSGESRCSGASLTFRTLALAVSAAAVYSPVASHAQTADICPALKQLVGTAESEFASLKGAQWRSPKGRLIDGAWTGAVAISGADCAVMKDDDTPAEYSCTWTVSSEGEATTLAHSLTRAASNCLKTQAQDLGSKSYSTSRITLYSSVVDIPGDRMNSISTSIIATSRKVRGEPQIAVSLSVSGNR